MPGLESGGVRAWLCSRTHSILTPTAGLQYFPVHSCTYSFFFGPQHVHFCAINVQLDPGYRVLLLSSGHMFILDPKVANRERMFEL